MKFYIKDGDLHLTGKLTREGDDTLPDSIRLAPKGADTMRLVIEYRHEPGERSRVMTAFRDILRPKQYPPPPRRGRPRKAPPEG